MHRINIFQKTKVAQDLIATKFDFIHLVSKSHGLGAGMREVNTVLPMTTPSIDSYIYSVL